MRTWVGYSTFGAGVLDATLESRTNIEAYFQGALTLDNVVCVPQGGVKRRPGLAYEATLEGRARLVPFEFNVEQRYVVAITDSRIDVYDAADGSVAEANITSPYDETEAFELDYAQSGDVMIITHPDHAPRRLARDASGNFALTTQALDFVPQFDFADASSPTPTSEVQTLTFDSSTLNGDEYKLELGGIETDAIRFSATASENHDRIKKALLDLPNTGSDGVSVTGTGIGPYTITFSGASANNWELMAARFVYTQSPNANGLSVARTSTGSPRTEDVWSSTRGWPRTVTFHEGRLWFGGSKSRPDTIWGSRVGQFFNFDPFRSRDDDGIAATLATAQVNVIQGITSGRALQVFTSGGEFFVPQPSGAPITPETVAFRRQTGYGAARIKPIIIDGATLFIDRGLRALREFVFSDTEDAYTAPPVNLRAPSLFQTPVDMAATQSADVNAANYVYVVMADGTVATLNTLRSEGITAWTRWATDGAFESVTVVDEEAWFCVRRTIDGVTTRFLERASTDHRLDAAVFDAAVGGTTVSGLSHLDGEEITIRDGLVLLGTATPSSGTVTLEDSTENAEAGLAFDVLIETMPLVTLFQGGSTVTRNKRLVRSHVDVYECAQFTVQGDLVQFRELPATFGGEAVYSGRQETWHDGWVEDRLVVSIAQEGPFPFHLRGIQLEVTQ